MIRIKCVRPSHLGRAMSHQWVVENVVSVGGDAVVVDVSANVVVDDAAVDVSGGDHSFPFFFSIQHFVFCAWHITSQQHPSHQITSHHNTSHHHIISSRIRHITSHPITSFPLTSYM